MDNVDLISTSEASRILGVTVSYVTGLARGGRLMPAVKLPGLRGAYLFERADVERLARERAA